MQPAPKALGRAPRAPPPTHRPTSLPPLRALPSPRDLEDTVVVAGGGPAGLAAALALQRVGMRSLVLERSAALPTAGAALGLWTNAWRALDALGAGNRVRGLHPVVNEVELCRNDGRVLRRFSLSDCDGGPHEFRGVRRASLVRALAELLPEDSLEFGAEVAEVRPSESGAEVTLTDGRSLRCLAVVGCDGVRSPTAAALGKPLANYAGQVAIRGVARVSEPPASAIRQVWGSGPRAGCYPLSSTELYWFVCFDAPANAPALSDPEAVRSEAAAVVDGWAWGLSAAVAATAPEDLSRSRIVDRWDVGPLFKGNKSNAEGEEGQLLLATLAGDALHPMTPNLGQGGCTALEDGVVLAQAVRRSGAAVLAGKERREALQRAFSEYERQRAARCLPLTVRANLMGAALQLPLPPVVAVRDWVVANRFDPGHFLDHATFDCGGLPTAGVAAQQRG